jgi:type II secretory pathway component GspD/PulD (secretin)
VARATTKAWLGIVAGMAFAQGEVAQASLPPVLVGVSGVMGQTPSRPGRVHAALNSGVESYRKGDYELAAAYFAQAQAGRDDLSDAERDELSKLIQLNATALKQRQDGRQILQQAELAANDGRKAEAEAYLKKVAGNQFLSVDDKLKVQKLAEALSGGTTVINQTPAPGKVMAQTKLQQARTMVEHGNYDAAERLAHEVEKMPIQWTEREDSPRKVLDDVARARMPTSKDPKSLLAAARMALQRGDLDNAERLAHESEKASNAWTWYPWGDKPEKVLKEVQLARVRKAVDASQQMAVNSGTGKVNKDGSPLQQTKHDSVPGSHGEMTPNKNKSGETVTLPSDPHELLRLGRELYAGNNLDEAEKMAQRAKEAAGSWGIFKDNPDRLLSDIRKSRKEESVRVLMEARKLYEQGQYEEAKAKAHRAEAMHGPYTLLDRGDRPEKLLAEIEMAQAKAPKVKNLPAPMNNAPREANPDSGTAVKAPNSSSMMPKSPVPSMSSTPPMPVVSGGYQIPDMNAPVTASKPSMDTPRPAAEMQMAQKAPAPAPMPVEDPKKPQAKRLLAEAHQCQQTGNLVEARQKVLQAQMLQVQFNVDEERPEMVLLQLTEAAKKQVDGLCQKATDFAVTASQDAKRFQMAEEALVQARRLAAGFALDTQPVDVKMAWVRQEIDRNQGSAPPVLQVQHQEVPSDIPSIPSGMNLPAAPTISKVTASAAPSVNDPGAAPAPVAADTNHGQQLLEKARQELRKGDTEMARRLAAEAYNGPYGVRDQADAILHSIDAEEISQKSLAANRSYEAGLTAYQRKDYALAGSIFQSVDVMLLAPDKQAKMRELLQMPEMQARVTTVGLKGTGAQDSAGATLANDAPGQPKRAPLEESYAHQVQALQEVQFQKLRDEGLRLQREAIDRFQAGETDRAIQLLENYLDGLKNAQLEPQRIALLRRPVEGRLQNFKALKAQQDFETARAGDRKSFVELRERQASAEEHKQKQVAEQLKLSHAAYKEGRYAEAETYATRAHELDPDNTQASAAVYIAHLARHRDQYSKIRDGKEELVNDVLDGTEDEGPTVNDKTPLKFDPKRWDVVKERKEVQTHDLRVKNEKEKEIEHKLIMPLSLNFKNTPFRQVVDDLRTWTGINIVVDKRALDEENISMDQPVVEMNLSAVSLKSALTNVLYQMRLTYVIEDEVLKITTEAHAKGRLVLKTYQVADLVIPVDDHSAPTAATYATMLGVPATDGTENHSMSTAGASPFTGQHSLPNGQPVSGSFSNQQNPSPSATVAQASKRTLEDTLIKLITNTIKPETWEASGGPGTIDYFPLGMALTINQTPDIQEQVQELLHALRRLQDQEVSVEIRFITIAEAFFERIGMDFNINIETNNTKFEPMVVSQQFQPFGFVNEPDVKGVVVGLQPTGSFTNSLDIPIGTNSFGLAVPPFGGFPNMPGADGGLSLGLAFLSDIQVFLFMEAAQGDRRTNVMQAPKLTLFNGQTSTINITDLQFFVTSVSFFLVNGQIVFVPNNTPIPTGVNLTIQAVITADRRFVRLNIPVTVTNLATPVTALFPVTTFVTPLFEGGAQGQPVPFTMFLQQPGFTTVTVNTTVMVPDGGTVLMGGLKTLREGRNEFGPPILSKLPYINRLFKNVGYGREAESLLLMVTPRIIINEEEEAKQTGVGPGLGGAAGSEQPQ